jgi:hypothetical protein
LDATDVGSFSAVLAILFGVVLGLIALASLAFGYYDGVVLFAALASTALVASALIALTHKNLVYLRGTWLATLVAIFFAPGGMFEGGLFTAIAFLLALAGLLTSLFARAKRYVSPTAT